MEKLPQISFIVPLYNEEETFQTLVNRLNEVMDNRPEISFEVVLVNDGSRDKTEELMFALGLTDARYHVLSLSRNFGHQRAVSAGLFYALATEAVMVMDGDLQDPPELFDEFYKELLNGNDVIYAVRQKRKESWFKRMSYHLFYRFLKKISMINMPLDSGDFSMVSRRVVDIMNQMPEESRYIRGLRAWIGFKQIGITYERSERFAGESKYSFKELFNLAYNGIFNFSEFPIKMISKIGFWAFAISIMYSIYAIIMKIVYNDVPQGFTALILAVTLFGSIQLLAIGIIGEYVTRIFFQAKERPLYIIKTQIKDKKVNGKGIL